MLRRDGVLEALDEALNHLQAGQDWLRGRLMFSTLALPLFLLGAIALISGLRGLLSGELPCGKRGTGAAGLTVGVALVAWALSFAALRLGDAETHGVRLW